MNFGAGRVIDDDCGRRWVLVYGQADWSRPTDLPGWLLPADSEVPHFFSRSGRLWRLQAAR